MVSQELLHNHYMTGRGDSSVGIAWPRSWILQDGKRFFSYQHHLKLWQHLATLYRLKSWEDYSTLWSIAISTVSLCFLSVKLGLEKRQFVNHWALFRIGTRSNLTSSSSTSLHDVVPISWFCIIPMVGSICSLGTAYLTLTWDYGLPTVVSLVARFFNSLIIVQYCETALSYI